MRTSAELREGFLSFFESKGHLRRPSAPLIPPADDPSTLFIVAGMQPMTKWFLGLEQPPADRITTVQTVMRAGGKHNDLDDVGSTARHESFFEMLGNFSFGDYFKDAAIDFAWEFVTERMGFAEEQIWATVFAGDPELGLDLDEVASAGWERVGVPRERIRAEPRSENFWQAAETGPCGPNSEVFLDRGEELGCGRPECGPNCDYCERFLEFWNLVFMEFDLRDDGAVVPLPKQNVDTGMGFERAAMLLQGVDSVFEIDTMRELMRWSEERSGMRYGESELATKAHRVLTDHSRAATFLIADGVIPSNEGRGYVLRRVIRRAVQFGRRIGLESPFLWELSALVREQMSQWYPQLEQNANHIDEHLRAEEERFSETLERGLRLLEELVAQGNITGEDAFRLHDTYGFPIELTRELALERGLTVDEETFTRLMAEQRERSRAGAGKEDVRAATFARTAGFQTDFVGWEKTEALSQIGALEELGDGTFLAKLRESPFYPAGGGQVTDAGFIEADDGSRKRADLIEAYRFEDDQALLFKGSGFNEADRVRAVVAWRIRFPTMANHTATHLLHKALREELGDHVSQAGSAVRPEKLRFDFTHPQALSPEQRESVERRVNEAIFHNLPVRTYITPIEEAQRLEATMLFGEKYGDEVRVVEIDDYSRELCGGTHVRTTAEIGAFVVTSEGSVGSGARRIEAVTSGEAYALLHARAREADELRGELERTRKAAAKPKAQAAAEFEIVEEAEAGGRRIVLVEAKSLKGGDLRDLSDRVKQQQKADVVLAGSVDDGRAYVVVNLGPGLPEAGVDAVAIIRELGSHIGGGGGGRPTLAEAGGKNPAGLREALTAGKEAVLAKLA